LVEEDSFFITTLADLGYAARLFVDALFFGFALGGIGWLRPHMNRSRLHPIPPGAAFRAGGRHGVVTPYING